MTTETAPTASQKQASDVSALLRARNPLIWIVTGEEARVEGYLKNAAEAAAYTTNTWDVAEGLVSGETKIEETEDIAAALAKIKTLAESDENNKRAIWILRDAPVWIEGLNGAAPLRRLRNLAKELPRVKRDNAQSLVILSPDNRVPKELAGHTTVIEWPLPDRAEIAAILSAIIDRKGLPADIQKLSDEDREAAIDAAVGLTGLEAEACYSKSLVQKRKIDPAVVASEKKRVITRENVLEWYDPLPGGLDAVGGLIGLKAWLLQRKEAYSPKAREFGLPLPKGTCIVGVQGCGKSLIAKAIATNWGVPLLRLDMGALKSKFVGESEQNFRKALKVIEAIGRCVLWIDEIEKSLQGATSGSADGGVSTDALGTLLTWAQERKGGAFIVATSNDIKALPPELLRKGRFDEIFGVDLPNLEERAAILRVSLKQYGRTSEGLDVEKIAEACPDFTGSEIAELVPTALYSAFADDARAITTADLLTAAGEVNPLAKTYPEKIKDIRDFISTRARAASFTSKKVVTKGTERGLDL